MAIYTLQCHFTFCLYNLPVVSKLISEYRICSVGSCSDFYYTTTAFCLTVTEIPDRFPWRSLVAACDFHCHTGFAWFLPDSTVHRFSLNALQSLVQRAFIPVLAALSSPCCWLGRSCCCCLVLRAVPRSPVLRAW